MPISSCVAPQIDQTELRILAVRYGQPLHRRFIFETDAHMRAYRGQKVPDRRGEVVFAIRQPNDEILLLTKHRYETPIYRLPTGGIERNESVEAALFREIAEETGQLVTLRRFLGVIECNFVSESFSVPFVSYIFYLESQSMELRPTDTDEIADYRTVPASELGVVAQALRDLHPKRRCWGYWRSLAHDLVQDVLGCGTHS